MSLITPKLRGEGTIGTDDAVVIPDKAHAIGVLLAYLVRRVRDGQLEMLDMVLDAGWAMEPSEEHDFERHFITLFGEVSPIPLKEALILASPRVPWHRCGHGDGGGLIHLWAAAASEIPHTDEIVRSVIEALLQIVCVDHLRPEIPVGMWS